jgi:hypothetical protein
MGGFMGVTLPVSQKCPQLLQYCFHLVIGVNEML